MLVVGAVIALRWPVLVSDLQSFGGDTTKWAGPAINFAQHGFAELNYLPTTSYGLYDVETRRLSRYITWPFPPSYMLTGFVLTFGESTWALRLLPLLLNLASAIYIYLIISRTFANSWWGLIGASYFLLIPGGLYYSLQICDTQFWLLGSIAGFYHLEGWRINRRMTDIAASTLWFLFACASSWFGYLAVLIAAAYVLICVLRTGTENRLAVLLRSPFPWLGVGVAVILAIHAAQLISAMGMERFISTYALKWQHYTGGSIVASHVADGNWWDSIRETVQIRVENILFRSLKAHIPLYFSLPAAIISFLSLLLFSIRAFRGQEQNIHKSCISILVFFSLFYLTYVLVFPSHMSRGTHNFTTQMLAPAFVVLFVYSARWGWSVIEGLHAPKLVTYLPVASLTVLLLVMSWSYRTDDPTQRSGGGRERMIEAARLYGSTVADRTNTTDLILSNHQGWMYDDNIMKFTSRRTVKLKLFDISQIENYVKDPRFKGVVFVFREKRDYE